MNRHLQSWAFLFILVIPGLMLLSRAWKLLPLYAHSMVRESVRSAMIETADREGWLLSDMLVTEITTESIQLTRRQHIRGKDPESCHIITLADSSLRPCD